MKRLWVVLFLAGPVWVARAQTAAMPSACGSMATTFVADVDATQHPAAVPAEGKALVYFIQDDGTGGEHQHFTLRIGLDGAWVGAYKQNSYFAVAVAPGEHHVCANVQSSLEVGKNVALAHFTAEAGKVYYFRTKFMEGLTTQYPEYPDLELDRPDSDEAKYLVGLYPMGIWTAKK